MPHPALHHLSQLGYTISETLQANQRYECYRAAKDGEPVFIKLALTGQPGLLANELWWSRTLAQLTPPGEPAPFRTPHVIALGPDWLITEYISAPKLVDETQLSAAAITPAVEAHLVDILIWLDQLTPLAPAGPLNSSLAKIDTWMERPLREHLITPQQVTAAKQLIEQYQAHIKPGLQHGDFVPWHIFAPAQGPLILFDAEHASLAKPRYYDLAYAYTRLFTKAQAPAAASGLLSRFLKAAQPDRHAFEAAFLPIITLRALGMHVDALADLATVDYRAEAKEVLRRCLERDLKAL